MQGSYVRNGDQDLFIHFIARCSVGARVGNNADSFGVFTYFDIR